MGNKSGTRATAEDSKGSTRQSRRRTALTGRNCRATTTAGERFWLIRHSRAGPRPKTIGFHLERPRRRTVRRVGRARWLLSVNWSIRVFRTRGANGGTPASLGGPTRPTPRENRSLVGIGRWYVCGTSRDRRLDSRRSRSLFLLISKRKTPRKKGEKRKIGFQFPYVRPGVGSREKLSAGLATSTTYQFFFPERFIEQSKRSRIHDVSTTNVQT